MRNKSLFCGFLLKLSRTGKIMSDCCKIEIKTKKTIKTLWIVLWINFVVFFVQFIAATIANSSSLLADSIDMMGDTLAYAISLYVINKGVKWEATASLCKGIIIYILACIILFNVIKQTVVSEMIPASNLMLIFSLIGLCANSVCLWLLNTYQNNNLNMKSVWICSRNDILVNLSVIITAGLVYYFQSKWPDIIVGLVLTILLFKSASHIIKLSMSVLKNDPQLDIQIGL